MFDCEILILELRFIVYTETARPVTPDEISALTNELGDSIQ